MKKALLGLSIAAALTACTAPRAADHPLEVWKNFEKDTVSAQGLGENQALAVFYRADDINGPAVNVYVNGDYQASLLPNAFSPVAVCADKNTFSSSFTTNQRFGNRTHGIKPILPVKEIAYFKVAPDANGRLSFMRVPSDVAEREIVNLPRENQTLPRTKAPKNCGAPVLAVETLDASALFAFDKYGVNDILPKGRQDVLNFAQKVQKIQGVGSIIVNGHTDPMGSAEYNRVLSQKRADTVKQLLQQNGVSVPVKATGFGKSEPVVTNCNHLPKKQRDVCNQPNRRVEIAIYGQEPR